MLDLIYSDVSRQIPTTSMNGFRHFITFIDDFSRYCWIYFLNHKSEVFDIFKSFKALFKNTFGKKIKALRSDNRGEYIKKEF